jgi:hypothetical protein
MGELSASTKALLATSRFLRATYLWVLIAVVALVLPFVVAWWAGKGDDDDFRLRVRLATAVLFVLGGALTAWVVLSLFLPYLNLLQSVAQ